MSSMAQENLLSVDGASIWYKISGNPNGPMTVYLHGGPGYNSHNFEKFVGQGLEKSLQMIYMDQRSCGRSGEFLIDKTKLGIDFLVEDIETLRRHVGSEKINLIGHSFGGALAIEYLQKYPMRASRLILVDITTDWPIAFENQVSFAASVAKKYFPEHESRLAELASSKKSASEKIVLAYEAVGRLRFQRAVLYATDIGQEINEEADAKSYLSEKSSGRLVNYLVANGYFDSHHSELMKPLSAPAQLFSGKHSQVIGKANIESAAKAWNIPVVWFNNSGHFPYVEEPERFVEEVIAFFRF